MNLTASQPAHRAKHAHVRVFMLFALISLSLMLGCSVAIAAPVIALDRISVATDGTQGNGNSSHGVISADGRFVAFDSNASTLVPNFESAGPISVFLRDRQLGTTELISAALAGQPQNGYSFSPAISGDGRYVAFNSSATNLVVGGTAAGTNVFVRDRVSGTTVQASVNDGGIDTDGGGQSVFDDEVANWISADGRYVVFHGYQKLTPNAVNGHLHLYRRDLVAHKTELVDVTPSGANGDGDGDGGSMSADGRFILFVSSSTDIVPMSNPFGDSNLYLRDMSLGTTTSITPNLSTSSYCDGGEGNLEVYDLSPNGRYAVFYADCTDIAPGQDAQDHLFVRDLWLASTSYLRINADGTPSDGGVYTTISDSGRYVVFGSQSTTIIPGATHNGDIYLRDRATASTYRISQRVDTGAPANNASELSSQSKNGEIVFSSVATNLIDNDTNGYEDVYVATLDALFSSGFE